MSCLWIIFSQGVGGGGEIPYKNDAGARHTFLGVKICR